MKISLKQSVRIPENGDNQQVELLKQLYQRKFFSPMNPLTAFEKVRNFQRRVKSNKQVHSLRSPSTNQVISKSFTAQVKQNTRYNQSENLVSQLELQRKKQRSMMDGMSRKRGQSRVDCFWPQEFGMTQTRKTWTSCIKQSQTPKSIYQRKSSNMKWRSQSRQTSPPASNGRISMQHQQKIRIRALQENRKLKEKAKNDRNALAHSLQKASENVMIDGRNLRQEANQHRIRSKQLQSYLQQLQRYSKQFKVRQPNSPVASKKMRPNRFSRNPIQNRTKIQAKDDNQELLKRGQYAQIKPWAVVDHELF